MNTVVVPTYNESENIAELASRLPRDVKILVVDDSPDNKTAQAAYDAGCQVYQRTQKRGLSSAVIDGINFANSDKVIVMDADLQHPPELVPKLLTALDTHDFVIASRYVDGGSCEEWTLKRRIISRVANLIALPLTPKIRDCVSGFFGFRRNGLLNLDGVNDRGFKIMLELLVRGNWNSVTEVPYAFVPRRRGQTKMRWTQIRDYLLQLVSLYLHKFRMLKFMLVGASGTIVCLSTLYLMETFVLHAAFQSQWGAVVADKSYLPAFVLAFILAVINNYTLNNLWTFRERNAGKIGFPKYLLVASVTLPLDLMLLYAFTEWLGLFYMLSAAIAIVITFVTRYIVASKWIWSK